MGDTELGKIRQTLREERENRICEDRGNSLLKCISNIKYIALNELKDRVSKLLTKQKHEFMSVVDILNEQSLNEKETIEYYARCVESVTNGDCLQSDMYIYAVATLLNMPIYILTLDSTDRSFWLYFPSLFDYDEKFELDSTNIPWYITMYRSNQDRKNYHKISSTDIKAMPPKALGIVGVCKMALTSVIAPENRDEYRLKKNVLKSLEEEIMLRNIVTDETVKSCKRFGVEIEARRGKVNTAVIVSSSTGVIGGILSVAGLILIPFTFGGSLGLTIAGASIGIGSELAGGSARTVEAVQQNTGVNRVKEKLNQITEKENAVAACLEVVCQLFLMGRFWNNTNGPSDGYGKRKQRFTVSDSVLRAVVYLGVPVVFAAARVSVPVFTVAAAVLGPLSIARDVGFIKDATYNKSKDNVTAIGTHLRDIAYTIEIKDKIFKSLLRGNCPDSERIIEEHFEKWFGY